MRCGEALHRLWGKARPDARARTDTSQPAFMRIGYGNVEAEALDVGEPCARQIGEPRRIDSGAVIPIPWRVVRLDAQL